MAGEDDLFLQEMAGITPIATPARAELGKPAKADPGLEARRIAAVTIANVDSNFLSTSYVPPVGPQDLINFHRPGVQHGVLRRLRLGQYNLDATLDLHRRSVAEARTELFDFVRDCVSYGLRTVLVSHGRGDRDATGMAVLKSYCAQWLPQIAEVLAVHTAQSRHGGYGSVYVLFKKGEAARNKNRELHGGRALGE